MQDLPEKSALLEAVARFLEQDLRPKVSDPALAFRVRIAAHLAELVSREVRAEAGGTERELDQLRQLLEDPGLRASGPRDATPEGAPGAPPDERAKATREAREALAARIRTASLDDAAFARLGAGLRQILGAKLAVSQPRFDLRLDIE